MACFIILVSLYMFAHMLMLVLPCNRVYTMGITMWTQKNGLCAPDPTGNVSPALCSG